MIYSNFTTYAISSFTGRNCVRFTELAYVVVAVFDRGRPKFVSKRKLHRFAVRQECRNDGKLQAEWKIGLLAGAASAPVKTASEVIQKRVNRAGFQFVEIKGEFVVGVVPCDKFERTVALQIAKENGWQIRDDRVFAC